MAAGARLSRIGARERRSGSRLPYARHLDERTILLRDGSLMQILHLEGFAFETADTDELNQKLAARDLAMRASGNSGILLYHHVVRRRVGVHGAGAFDDPICREIDRRWLERLETRQLFANELFLTIVARPPKGKAGMAARLFRRRSKQGSSAMAELNAAREALSSALSAYGPRLLSLYDGPQGCCSEPLELISCLFNGEMKPVLCPEGDAGDYLPYRRISFGRDGIEFDGVAVTGYAGLLSIKEYPAYTAAGALDPLLRLPYELVITQSFAFADRQTAVERVDLAIRRLRAADDDTTTLRLGLLQAKDDLVGGRSAFGQHHMTVLVRTDELDALDAATAEAAAALGDCGIIAVRESLNLEPAYWAQFPGNEAYIVRRALISTANLAGLASLHSFPLGRAEGNFWGSAVATFETTSNTPYHFNFHVGDLGHFTIIGPSGSGKTVVLNFLAAQAQRFAPRTVLFDKDRGSEIFIRAVGGRYASFRAGEPTGLNPLQLPDTPANRAFLRGWLAQLVGHAGAQVSVQDETAIAAAINANYAQPSAYRQLRYLREMLAGGARPQPGDLAHRLAAWHGAGESAWLFDNAEDRFDFSALTLGFDMTELLDAPVLRTPAMSYLFHRIDQALDGSPAMILIDEGWKVLDDPVFAVRLKDWMKTLRKRNAVIGFGTQSARDALESRIASTIVEQAATQIFMANPRAHADDYCAGFDLSPHELELVRTLPPHARCFLVKHGSHSVVVRLDLSGMPDMLIALSGAEATVRRLDDLRARFGDDPSAWWQALTRAPYPGIPPARPGRLRVAAE